MLSLRESLSVSSAVLVWPTQASECSVGDLRLRLPRLIDSYDGTVNATTFGNQCIQQQASGSGPDLPPDILETLASYSARFSVDLSVPQSEDCEYPLGVWIRSSLTPH